MTFYILLGAKFHQECDGFENMIARKNNCLTTILQQHHALPLIRPKLRKKPSFISVGK